MSGEEENENNATFSGADFGPRVGGMTADGVVWVGGNPDDPRNNPKNPCCYQPTTWKEATKTYEMCTAGLTDKIELEGKMTMSSFLNRFESFLTIHGMDSVFYLNDEEEEKCFLVRDYANFTFEQVEKEVTKLKNEGDQYDEQNLEWSGQALLASIGTSLASTLEKYVTTEITGPELFFHIMETLESTFSSALRTV